MAHQQQNDFVVLAKAAFPAFFAGGRVLEIGSLDINGSVRQHFSADQYLGLDVGVGPGVDIVCQGQDYDAETGSFDVVISCECLEHNPFWLETFSNMLRLCRPGGLVLMTCATTGRPEHGTRLSNPESAPLLEWDYYRNLEGKDFRRSIDFPNHLAFWMFYTDNTSYDLYFLGFKKGAQPPSNAYAALVSIRLHYLVKNFSCRLALRNWLGLQKRRLLILLFGEQRYMAGSLLPWKRQSRRK